MHILEGGVRYTYYCTSGNCDSLYNTYEAGDANAIPGTETYTFDNNILTTVFSGGPYSAPVEWECEGNIMKFTNINGTVRWIKLNTNVNDCITSEILELSGKTPNDNKMYDLLGRELREVPVATMYIQNRKIHISY
jgi:hypothetical protein